jgi:hypothetical protein
MMTSGRIRTWLARGLVPCLLVLPELARAYPLDGYESTGIFRLEAQRLVQVGKAKGKKRPPGELLPLEKVDLRLLDRRDLTLPAADPALTAVVKRLLGAEAGRYGIALLDLSDLDRPRYAEWHGNQHQNPGSVGKILVALGIFQALADMYPDDIDARKRILRETTITADIFSVYDHHTVRMYDPKTKTLFRRPIKEGDQASLWTFLDWMMSPSSNSAAGMLQKHLILMAHFGRQYPPSPEEEKRFFEKTPKKELAAIFEKAIQSPVTRSGLDLRYLRQGSFCSWTSGPAVRSSACSTSPSGGSATARRGRSATRRSTSSRDRSTAASRSRASPARSITGTSGTS